MLRKPTRLELTDEDVKEMEDAKKQEEIAQVMVEMPVKQNKMVKRNWYFTFFLQSMEERIGFVTPAPQPQQ